MTPKTKKRIDEPSSQMKRYFNNRIKGNNKKDSAIKAGYSKTTANAVKQGIEDKPSYDKLLRKYIPKDKILKALDEDIDKKPQNRHSELQLASKIQGMLSDKIDITTKQEALYTDDQIKAIAKRIIKSNTDSSK